MQTHKDAEDNGGRLRPAWKQNSEETQRGHHQKRQRQHQMSLASHLPSQQLYTWLVRVSADLDQRAEPHQFRINQPAVFRMDIPQKTTPHLLSWRLFQETAGKFKILQNKQPTFQVVDVSLVLWASLRQKFPSLQSGPRRYSQDVRHKIKRSKRCIRKWSANLQKNKNTVRRWRVYRVSPHPDKSDIIPRKDVILHQRAAGHDGPREIILDRFQKLERPAQNERSQEKAGQCHKKRYLREIHRVQKDRTWRQPRRKLTQNDLCHVICQFTFGYWLVYEDDDIKFKNK